ncbi:hypothetical protein C8Q74DRAFT_1052434 [Fomes fomentarius]|nr:hypothetical protein C8Q74DRAFT_1052434 [Fomes fomentarius]
MNPPTPPPKMRRERKQKTLQVLRNAESDHSGDEGCLLGITGGLVRVWCHRALGHFFTWEIRRTRRAQTNHRRALLNRPTLIMVAGSFTLLITKGPFFTEAGLWESAGGSLGAGVRDCGILDGAVRCTSVSDEFGGQAYIC